LYRNGPIDDRWVGTHRSAGSWVSFRARGCAFLVGEEPHVHRDPGRPVSGGRGRKRLPRTPKWSDACPTSCARRESISSRSRRAPQPDPGPLEGLTGCCAVHRLPGRSGPLRGSREHRLPAAQCPKPGPTANQPHRDGTRPTVPDQSADGTETKAAPSRQPRGPRLCSPGDSDQSFPRRP